MVTSAFQPPNSQSFSEEVMSVVMPRTCLPRSRVFSRIQGSAKPDQPCQTRTNPISLDSRSARGTPVLTITAALRERHRLNQAKYRQKQRELIEHLEDANAQLQEEIRRLAAWNKKKVLRAPTDKSLWSIVADYFHIFQRAFKPPPAPEHVRGLAFLESVMAPDVISASACGVEALLKNWMLISHCFEDVHVQLEHMAKGPTATSLVATTTTSLTITAKTVQRAFPHLVGGKAGSESQESWSSLAIKLLGQRIVMRGSVYFQWDGTSSRMAVIQSQSDMLSPILDILGKFVDVSRVFEKALVTSNFQPVA
ncbi:hypothetical protein ON010_g14929 [Phytophthora cinnamomi]|nr:hypothetical protein ON010_g14929 [Phytophthora cinnamomi]